MICPRTFSRSPNARSRPRPGPLRHCCSTARNRPRGRADVRPRRHPKRRRHERCATRGSSRARPALNLNRDTPVKSCETGLIQKWAACRRCCSRKANTSQRPTILTAISGKLPGSGTAAVAGTTVVCAEELVTVVVPSRFTSIVKANPLVVSVVRAGIVPAGSENMLKANLLPELRLHWDNLTQAQIG